MRTDPMAERAGAASGPGDELPRPSRRPMVVVVVLLLLVGLLAGAAPAGAICKDPPCRRDPSDQPPPPPPPTVTKITTIAPSFAWSGDTITLTGAGFPGAGVTVDGLPAAVVAVTPTLLRFTVPTITNAVVGPVTVPVVVVSPTGTASTGFTLSPTLQVSAGATFGINSQFGQGADGSAGATATLDRSSGFTQSTMTVKNTQTWLSLTVTTSTVWLDAAGRVIGFTPVHAVTSTGWTKRTLPRRGRRSATWPCWPGTSRGRAPPSVGPAPFAAARRSHWPSCA